MITKFLIRFTCFLLFFQSGFAQISNLGANSLTNGGALTNQAVVVPAIVDPGPLPPNVIAFDYDAAGNQIKRRYIYVTNGIYRHTNPVIAEQPKKVELIESDIYKDILYFPNPVQSELFVQWSNSNTNAVESIELYSISGQLMRRFENLKNKQNTTINFELFPSGYYILNLTYSDGTLKDLQIIKK